jgi:hypothetical protein
MLVMLVSRRTRRTRLVDAPQRGGEHIERIARARLPLLGDCRKLLFVRMRLAVMLFRMDEGQPDQGENGDGGKQSRAVLAEALTAVPMRAPAHGIAQPSGIRRGVQERLCQALKRQSGLR